MQFLFAVVLSGLSIFLVLLVLVQRGRGGGLAGALGGMGGQSAFGTKAGDTFTRVTMVSATIWILIAILAVKILGTSGGPLGDAGAADASQPVDTVPGPLDGGTAASLDDLLPTNSSSDSADASSGDAPINNAGANNGIGGTVPATGGSIAAEADPDE